MCQENSRRSSLFARTCLLVLASIFVLACSSFDLSRFAGTEVAEKFTAHSFVVLLPLDSISWIGAAWSAQSAQARFTLRHQLWDRIRSYNFANRRLSKQEIPRYLRLLKYARRFLALDGDPGSRRVARKKLALTGTTENIAIHSPICSESVAAQFRTNCRRILSRLRSFVRRFLIFGISTLVLIDHCVVSLINDLPVVHASNVSSRPPPPSAKTIYELYFANWPDWSDLLQDWLAHLQFAATNASNSRVCPRRECTFVVVALIVAACLFTTQFYGLSGPRVCLAVTIFTSLHYAYQPSTLFECYGIAIVAFHVVGEWWNALTWYLPWSFFTLFLLGSTEAFKGKMNENDTKLVSSVAGLVLVVALATAVVYRVCFGEKSIRTFVLALILVIAIAAGNTALVADAASVKAPVLFPSFGQPRDRAVYPVPEARWIKGNPAYSRSSFAAWRGCGSQPWSHVFLPLRDHLYRLGGHGDAWYTSGRHAGFHGDRRRSRFLGGVG